MNTAQPGILPAPPSHSRYLEFGRRYDGDAAAALAALGGMQMDDGVVVGLGAGLIRGLGSSIIGLEAFPNLSGPGCELPSTQSDLWIWVRGEDRGEIMHRARALEALVGAEFRPDHMAECFRYMDGHDLTGYEDGTENPEGAAAIDAAFAQGKGKGLDGGSFVAVQQWVHDLNCFAGHTQAEQDNIIGRRLSDNEELDDAPVSAHVKRTAQESFEPEAFVLRRSMPWADASGEGLMFVAFGKSHAAFGAQMRRMAGLDDGIVDALFEFPRPVTGSYFWCPPAKNGHLDLSALGL